MRLIPCPYCGARPEIEFSHAGEAFIARPKDPSALDDAAWAAYLYERSNIKGAYAERWYHEHGCGRFFNLRRDTATDRVLGAGRSGEPLTAPGEGDPQ